MATHRIERPSIARAPGRLDVMGGIADYSGSLVLQLPLAVATTTTAAFISENRYVVTSRNGEAKRRFSVDVRVAATYLASCETARSYFAERPHDRWVSYVLGCLTILHSEEDLPLPEGLTIEIASDVPEGKGVSSSAALEVSVMGALLHLLGVSLDPERIAALCQMVENRVAGAPCGIMDQMTAACGRRDHLLRLLCQPAILEGHVALPDGLSIWGIDSGIRHSVGGSDYGTVRTAAAMGYRILASLEGLVATPTAPGRVAIRDERFGGYLANVDRDILARHLDELPERMKGSVFLSAFGGIADPTVDVNPGAEYPVRAATVHPILEFERIRRFAAFLEMDPTAKTSAMMGELMYLSHVGYSACGLGSEGTDRIVELVKDEGYHKGLFGARITGGGSGGTVAILASADAGAIVHKVAERYRRESGLETIVFEGSSDGLKAERQTPGSRH